MTAPDDYFTRPGVRWSLLRHMWKGSPLHYRHAADNPTSGDTPSRQALRAIHCAVLEPERWATDYAAFDGARRGNAWDRWQLSHPGVEGLSRKAWDTASRIAQRVHAHPVAGPLLIGPGGESEVMLEWADDETGLLCRGRADRIVTPGGRRIGLDLKTVGDCSEAEITKMAWRMGWHGQAAHYMAGGSFDAFGLVCVEDKEPHDLTVFWMSRALLEAGEALRRRLIDRVAECTRAGIWPGRHPDPVMLDAPHWVEPTFTDSREAE
jgi:hypothetical protein